MTGHNRPLLLVPYCAASRTGALTRDSGFPLRLTLPTVAPGQTPGALRFVSLALHILSQGRKAPQVRFSEECFRILLHPETDFF